MREMILRFVLGSGDTGFGVMADFWREGNIIASFHGVLPANQKLFANQRAWLSQLQNYCFLKSHSYRAKLVVNESSQGVFFSTHSFKLLSKQILHQFNEWLNTDSFESIKSFAIEFFTQNPNARILICADNLDVLKLPWNEWSLIKARSEVGMACSGLNFKRLKSLKLKESKLLGRLKILVVKGDSKGLPFVDKEVKLFNSLPNVECQFLSQPSIEEFDDILETQNWNILFFTGHGSTNSGSDGGSEGVLHINSNQLLTIDNFSHHLCSSIERGLQLVILNCCDGLAMSQQLLTETNLPYSIAMRHDIPDKIAYRFIDRLTFNFAEGLNLHLAVRAAQESLEVYHHEFPLASSLPVIYQQITASTITWNKSDWSKNNVFLAGCLSLPISFGIFRSRLTRFISSRRLGLVFLFSHCILTPIIFSIGVMIVIDEERKESRTLTSKKQTKLSSESRRNNQFVHSSSYAAFDVVSERVSLGQTILFSNPAQASLLKGAKKFAEEKYVLAAQYFLDAHRRNPSDPEALIYFNNANALLQRNKAVFQLAVLVSSRDTAASAETLRGVAMAQDEYNEQRSSGDPALQIRIVDDGGSREWAIEIAKTLKADKDVLGVIKHDENRIDSSILVEYERAELPLISLDRFSTDVKSKALFRISPSNAVYSDRFVRHLKSFGSQKVAIFYGSNNDDTKDLKERSVELLRESNITVVLEYNLSSVNSNPELELAKLAYENKVDTALIISGQHDRYLVRDLIKINETLPQEKQLQLLTNETVDLDLTSATTGNLIHNLTAFVPWNDNTPEAQDFLARGRQLWEGNVNWRSAFAFDAVMALVKALASSDTLSRQDLLSNLRSLKLNKSETSGRELQFSADGSLVSDSELSVVRIKVDNNSNQPIF